MCEVGAVGTPCAECAALLVHTNCHLDIDAIYLS